MQNSRDQERLEHAIRIADEAGDITLRYFGSTDLEVDRKKDDSPVTVADREAERRLRARIAEVFPDDAILGEEFPATEGSSGYRWILDPIDGTKSFIHGVPLYATLIGIEREGEPVVGVILIPALGEMVFAARGQGAWYRRGQEEPTPAKVSQRAMLSEGLFVTSEILTFDQVGRRDAYDRLQADARLSRTWGDAYGYLLVATGRAEVMVDPEMNAWDAAPMLTILEEAGGRFTDWQGNRSIHGGEGVGTNGLVHDEVLAVTSRSPADQ